MALLAEELVEEWLNRQGFFTIRGIKMGVHDMDLLAVRPTASGCECRHMEVQASARPVTYISPVPKATRRQTGRAVASARRRTRAELSDGVDEWVLRKFDSPEKRALRERLWPSSWSRELVVHVVRSSEELELIADRGVRVHRLEHIIAELKSGTGVIAGAAGAPLVELMSIPEAQPEA